MLFIAEQIIALLGPLRRPRRPRFCIGEYRLKRRFSANMVKKKESPSIFSTIAEQIDPQSHSGEYHLIDDEYFASFDNLDDINRYQTEIDAKAPSQTNETFDIDMKTFAEQFLIDGPTSSSISTSVEQRSKRTRRNIRDLPQSSHFVYMSDNDNGNIFDSLKQTQPTTTTTTTRAKRIAYEEMSSILLTLDTKAKKKRKTQSTIVVENTETSTIKDEPIEPDEVKSNFFVSIVTKSFRFQVDHQSRR